MRPEVRAGPFHELWARTNNYDKAQAPQAVAAFLQDLIRAATIVYPTRRISAALDEDDNRFLECVRQARADYLVTGNTRHFPFAAFEGTQIVSPAEFARLLME